MVVMRMFELLLKIHLPLALVIGIQNADCE